MHRQLGDLKVLWKDVDSDLENYIKWNMKSVKMLIQLMNDKVCEALEYN
jgi:hypothetical protein